MDEWETRHLWLLNAFYHVANITLITAIIQTYIVDGAKEGNFLLEMAVLFELGFIALIFKKPRIAESWFLLFGNLIVFLTNNIYGPESGVYLYYFPFMLVIAYLVDLKNLFSAVFHITITVAMIIAGIFIQNRFLYHKYSAEQAASSFHFSFFISALSMGLVALIIVRMSYIQYNDFLERIEERNKAEASMQNALREKETLLAEVHHRVKNNLAVISSLLNLQMNSVTNEYTRSVLRESRNRVGSMALIHRKLYQNKNVEEIDFANYADSLAQEIAHSYEGTGTQNISVTTDATHMNLPLNVAVPCGLVLNEILSNCYKHAFPGGRKGHIHIRFDRSGDDKNRIVLEINDDGIGLPENTDIDKATSLGLTIISSLAGQLDAEWGLAKQPVAGTSFRMSFTLPPVPPDKQA